MRKYLLWLIVTMLIVQIGLPGAERASASSGSTYVLVDEVGNGTSQTPADADKTKAKEIGIFGEVYDMVIDASGNLYFTIAFNHVYKVTPSGDLSVFAGIGTYRTVPYPLTPEQQDRVVGKRADEVSFIGPRALTIDSDNNMYIAENRVGSNESSKVIKVNLLSNKILAIYDVTTQGPNVRDIALDSSGNLYMYSFDTNQSGFPATFYLDKLDVTDGTFTSITDIELPVDPAGSKFEHIAVDSQGDLYFSKPGQYSAIFKYSISDSEPELTTFASRSSVSGGIDFQHPRSMAFDADDNLYFTTAATSANSNYGNQIIKVTQTGTKSLIAGNVDMLYGNSPEGTEAINAFLGGPRQIAIHPVNGTIYLEEYGNKVIRSIRPAYNIAYEGNGPSGGTPPADQQMYENKPATIATHGSLVKEGHTFVTWNTAADGSGTDYTAGVTITPTSDLTLYAIWELEKYNLIYNAGANGTLTSGSLEGQTVIRHDNVPYNNAIDPVTAVPNEGYAFVGWDDSLQTAQRHDPVTSSLNVTANFLKQHTVTFDTYGGSTIEQLIVLDGELLTLPAPPTNGDYTFDGWYTDAEWTSLFDAETPITENLTLFAKWETKYTVTVHSNNGTPASDILVTRGDHMSPLADPEYEGHTFRGWYADEDFTDGFDFATPITGDMSIYAKWDVNEYTVTFETHGGTEVIEQTVNYNELLDGSIETTLDGHTFRGWYTDADYTTAFDIATTPITTNMQLHAKWEIKRYTVTFATYGGTGISNQMVNYNNKLVVESVTTTRDGHTFLGWFTDSDYTTTFDIANTPITENLHLHAKWKINEYTVTFDTLGGTTVSSHTVNYNERVVGPIMTTREGYSFVGWYMIDEDEVEHLFDIDNTVITRNITLHAKWELTPPGAPTIVSTVASDAKVELVWNPVPFATEYNIYQGTVAGATDTLVATVTNSVYEVTGLTNGTTYYFVVGAVNESGEKKSVETSAKPMTVAGAPTAVTAVAGNGQATITFTAPSDNGGSAITGYRVTASPGDIVVTTTNDDTSIVVTGLTNGVTYTFTVEALNAVGYGETSEASSAVTPITVAGAPTGVTAIPGNEQVTITFNAPSNNGGSAITGYRVTALPGNLVVTTMNVDITVEMMGLTNGTSYTFTVEALNAAGYGEASEASSAVAPRTVAGAPTDVTAVAGNGQATITFTAPSDDGGSAITGYRVTASPEDIVVTTTNSNTTITVTGLTNNTSYTFTVEALNGAGYGAASAATDAVTPKSPPVSDSNEGSTVPAGNVESIVSTNGEITLPVGQAGEVQLGEEILITIPAGASEQELKLTIEQVADLAGLANDEEVFASPVFELLKSFRENFAEPVVLTFKFDPSKVQEGQRVAIFYYDETEKIWVEVGGQVDGDTITAEVDHFTKFAVLVVGDVRVEEPEIPSFSDITGHWGEANIKQAVQQGIVSGYPDGTFKPNAPISRAEFTVMLMNALKSEAEGEALSFTDGGNIGAWARAAVAKSIQAGIVSGYADGSFRPGANISRAELAVMAARAYGETTSIHADTGFADDSDIPAWARAAIAKVKQLGIVSGQGGNRFAPNANATRAEAVTIILNLLHAK